MSILNLPKLPKDYSPLDDKDEYMNPRHLAYFKNLLENEKKRLIESIQPKINDISNPEFFSGDEGDIASSETQRSINLRLTDRQSKLIKKIEQALLRIDTGDYGYCEVTGNEIGIPRLLARPMTSLCVAEQERREANEKVHEQYEENEYILTEDVPEQDEE